MAATDYATLTTRVRTLGDDTATSNYKPGDVPQGLRNSANTIFRLSFRNVVVSSVLYTYGAGTIRSATGFTILDQLAQSISGSPGAIGTTGYVSITSAPDQSTTQPLYFDYFYLWFSDADYQVMIDEATEILGGTAGQSVVEGLYPALIQFALMRYWTRRSSTWATFYQSSGGGASADPKTPTQNFLALAKMAADLGKTLMMNYYTRQGQREAPASGSITYGVDPYTPKR